MKKLLLVLGLVLAMLLPTNDVNAQVGFSLNGGYSWINGVIGAEVFIGDYVGLSTGWMPTSMPKSGEKLSSWGFGISGYQSSIYENGTYASFGIASKGYRYEETRSEYTTIYNYNTGRYENDYTSSSYEETQPMSILMVGYRWGWGDGTTLKAGVGYGWCEQASAISFEIIIGIGAM